jgi:RimJ/RimL family protein N-acetyltransferase
MARAVMAHGFDTLGLARIVGVTYPENEPSQRVLLKIGMRAEGEAVHYGRTMRVFAAERAAFENEGDR